MFFASRGVRGCAALAHRLSGAELYALADRDPELHQLIADARERRREALIAEPARLRARRQRACVFALVALVWLLRWVRG